IYQLRTFASDGSKKANRPSKGSKATIIMVDVNPIASIVEPNTIEPIAPIPKAKPTIRPDIVPTFPGISFCAYTTATEKLDIKARPMIAKRRSERLPHTYGNSKARGAGMTKDNIITVRFPKRYAKGPPKNVPIAPTNKKVKI